MITRHSFPGTVLVMLAGISIVLIIRAQVPVRPVHDNASLREWNEKAYSIIWSLNSYEIDYGGFPVSLEGLATTNPQSLKFVDYYSLNPSRFRSLQTCANDPFCTASLIQYVCDRSILNADRWFLLSAGPDCVMDINARNYRKPTVQSWYRDTLLKTYDPTNGSGSSGDLWHSWETGSYNNRVEERGKHTEQWSFIQFINMLQAKEK